MFRNGRIALEEVIVANVEKTVAKRRLINLELL